MSLIVNFKEFFKEKTDMNARVTEVSTSILSSGYKMYYKLKSTV